VKAGWDAALRRGCERRRGGLPGRMGFALCFAAGVGGKVKRKKPSVVGGRHSWLDVIG